MGKRVAIGHCFVTVTSDHISATLTYVMWREERLWNVSVLQRVHLSSRVRQEPGR
jgi:hypothetical protein